MMSDPELIKTAQHLKDQGNIKFKEKAFKIAEGQYKDALSHAETVKNDTPELNKLKIAILQNMSVCTNNTGDYRDTVRNCGKAIQIDNNAAKALYLRSVAYMNLGELDDAMADIKSAIKISPQDTNLRAQFENIKKERSSKAQKQKASLAAFFSQGVYNDKSSVKVQKKHDKLPDFKPENV